ncbi:MAG: Rrf2 family transcriptional regulator [Candidatus Omnitrophica bacterium]|nr:Rrf2 family transcriptional regulator [Candidatus Omnitrophota bacterium]
MLQIYSKGCEYGIRALSYLRPSDCRGGFSVEVICRRARLPVWFTRKVFQALVKRGVLLTQHGPGGGYSFRKNPSRISLLDLIESIDGKNVFKRCILGKSRCDHRNPCSVHATWKRARKILISELDSTSIKQIMNQKSFSLIKSKKSVKGD